MLFKADRRFARRAALAHVMEAWRQKWGATSAEGAGASSAPVSAVAAGQQAGVGNGAPPRDAKADTSDPVQSAEPVKAAQPVQAADPVQGGEPVTGVQTPAPVQTAGESLAVAEAPEEVWADEWLVEEADERPSSERARPREVKEAAEAPRRAWRSEKLSDEEYAAKIGDAVSERIGEVVTAREEPDVMLQVPELKVDDINLDVENLRARVSLSTAVANLVTVNAGVDAMVDRLKLGVKGVDAKALLRVRLDQIVGLIARSLETIDKNPQILASLLRPVEESAARLGHSIEQAAPKLLESTAETARQTLPGAVQPTTVRADVSVGKVTPSTQKGAHSPSGSAPPPTIERAVETASAPSVGGQWEPWTSVSVSKSESRPPALERAIEEAGLADAAGGESLVRAIEEAGLADAAGGESLVRAIEEAGLADAAGGEPEESLSEDSSKLAPVAPAVEKAAEGAGVPDALRGEATPAVDTGFGTADVPRAENAASGDGLDLATGEPSPVPVESARHELLGAGTPALEGWKIVGGGRAAAAHHGLVTEPGSDLGLVFHTQRLPGDFVLDVDFRLLESNARSPIYLRMRDPSLPVPDPEDPSKTHHYENPAYVPVTTAVAVDISHNGAGTIGGEGALETVQLNPGEWHHLHVEVRGQEYGASLDDKPVAHFTNTDLYRGKRPEEDAESGYLGIGIDGGWVEFANLAVSGLEDLGQPPEQTPESPRKAAGLRAPVLLAKLLSTAVAPGSTARTVPRAGMKAAGRARGAVRRVTTGIRRKQRNGQ